MGLKFGSHSHSGLGRRLREKEEKKTMKQRKSQIFFPYHNIAVSEQRRAVVGVGVADMAGNPSWALGPRK
jgi:hypothetical protein